ncbi:hypothetical protein CEUSTIGMA_g5568.t1 [Chlamydomonas eustigma]|uniref:Uncharacterized protein n=1 Tax=Chlamydomonas eustigma TaxID=1157962 RepID=A0A250X503_9CHLO|nr:hypothetical protein CEUSTIGMA_g5568.t1 [Chlamydomonas eustigma]|eukprot:GAX78126.1 hypothetical protein CEUSTIGMA_g5568.t1 [Chlamydomonas eustigma]
MDAWSYSHHQVFRRIAALSTRVLAYFRAREECWRGISGRFDTATFSPPTESSMRCGEVPGLTYVNDELSMTGAILEDMILWLSTYRDLFTRSCNMTGKLLSNDPTTQYLMPPLFRPFLVSRRQLRLMAADMNKIEAYHMHAAPEQLLKWGI